MVKLEKINIAKTQEYINAIYSRRSVLSNYYGQPVEENDKYFETNSTFVLAKPVRDFNRIYVASNDKKELVEILSSLEGTNVINFPTKGDIRDIEAIMTECGYEQIGVYERFVYNVKNITEYNDVSKIELAQAGDEEQIYNLYATWQGFDFYTGYLPTHEEIESLVKNKSILVNKNDEKVTGVFIFEPQGRKYYLRLWIDICKQGLILLKNVFGIMKQNNIDFAYLWASSENKRVISLHQSFGATPDGLKDYTFIKK